MPYDFDDCLDKSPPILKFPQTNKEEIIKMALEVAAIYLTPTHNSLFTVSQLIDTTQEILNKEFDIIKNEIIPIIEKISYIKKVDEKHYCIT